MKSTTRYNKSIEVFDILCGEEFYHVEQSRKSRYLRDLLKNVWAKHGRKNSKCPSLKFVRTPKSATGIYDNWCDGLSAITLNEQCKNISTLLHEIVHALGYYKHSSGFVLRYADLMAEYGRCDYTHMIVLAKIAGTL